MNYKRIAKELIREIRLLRDEKRDIEINEEYFRQKYQAARSQLYIATTGHSPFTTEPPEVEGMERHYA